MSRTKERKPQQQQPRATEMDDARNELFSHVHRCGVLRATQEQQVEWMDDTVEFIGERYPSLSKDQLDELKAIGLRFCSPVIANAPAKAEAEEEDATEAEAHATDIEAQPEDAEDAEAHLEASAA
ncbi:MAG TPA: hypothetical protein VFE05_13630 [Longimicrobiaceae bacterium]|nr:hypothetical protein [Longimicrobiaceae bacterium]